MLHITLNVTYTFYHLIFTFYTLKIFQTPSPAGQAGEASRPKIYKLKTYITFPEEKAWKPGVVWS